MSLVEIVVLGVCAGLIGWAIPRSWRSAAILVASLLALFWLQPLSPIRNLDFWLPVAAIGLAAFAWAVVRPAGQDDRRQTLAAALLIAGVVLAIGLTRYAGPVCCLTAARPPDLVRIMVGLGLIALCVAIPYRFFPGNRRLPGIAIGVILGLFIVLKSGLLASQASAGLRWLTGQSTSLAGTQDIAWLGFSYLAFRLLHILRDYQTGKLPAYTLSEFLTYALFFPSYPAGPIDRAQRFIPELQGIAAGARRRDGRVEDAAAGVQRILIGAFKKFVLADSLALIALNPQYAAQTSSVLWTWVLVLAYSLRIYFDFSGYTDIALGLGRLMGFHLPENFAQPYFKTNLTAFWNSWHITLAQWFRAYYFNPLTRWLRTHPAPPPTWVIILAGQLSTMVLIGLWHGITWNFFIWGAWHGLGLFAHNRWTEWLRGRGTSPTHRLIQGTMRAGSWALTFGYVSLGWVWFALPTPASALLVFRQLSGL